MIDIDKNSSNNNADNNINIQLESYIKNLENDLKYIIKKQFIAENRIDILEIKIRRYIEIEEEYEELKGKVRYEDGKFLDNDRKDNEIIILRRENSILKKTINKLEEKIDNFQIKDKEQKDTIDGLKLKIEQLDKKIEQLTKELNEIKNKNKNLTINSNINDISNLNKNIIEYYNKNTENNSLGKINTNNISNSRRIRNSKINKYLERGYTNSQLPLNKYYIESNIININKALNTIDNSNKLFISKFNNKNKINPLKNYKLKNAKKNKSNSVSKINEDKNKSELHIKYLSNHKNDFSHSIIKNFNKRNIKINELRNKVIMGKIK